MIATESLLGGKYMSLEPGVDDETIAADGTGRITRTQAPMRLDDLIGQVIYGSKRGESDSGAAAAGRQTRSARASVILRISKGASFRNNFLFGLRSKTKENESEMQVYSSG